MSERRSFLERMLDRLFSPPGEQLQPPRSLWDWLMLGLAPAAMCAFLWILWERIDKNPVTWRAPLAVAFAAFCIWLTVWIINRRERWVKWMPAVVVGVPVLYAVSVGPANWLLIRGYLPQWVVMFYRPLLWFVRHAPAHVAEVVNWWIRIWLGNN